MSLIKCSECGKEISDKSKKCVNCGAPVKGKDKHIKNGLLNWLPILISSVVFFMLIMIYNVMNTQYDSDDLFFTVFNSIFLILSIVSIILNFYVIPRERKILFPLSFIISIFVFMSVMGTAFSAFN